MQNATSCPHCDQGKMEKDSDTWCEYLTCMTCGYVQYSNTLVSSTPSIAEEQATHLPEDLNEYDTKEDEEPDIEWLRTPLEVNLSRMEFE